MQSAECPQVGEGRSNARQLVLAAPATPVGKLPASVSMTIVAHMFLCVAALQDDVPAAGRYRSFRTPWVTFTVDATIILPTSGSLQTTSACR